uniref:VP4 n=1 Tax=Phylloscopus inornatus ambidensovirus TaxID=2794452 RepID=A0A8E7G2A6_9VIRU|nr:MAG: VP4 [Phylloscopus inornatus ambidensovirus]
MSKRPHRGQQLYSDINKALSVRYKELKARDKTLTWTDFQRSDAAKVCRESFKRSRLHVDEQQPGPSSASERPASPGLPDIANPAVPDDSDYDHFDPDSILADLFPNQNMDIDPPLEGEASGSSGPRGAHGASSSGSPLVPLSKSTASDGWSMNFTKSRTAFAYAYCNAQLNLQSGLFDGVCTSMAYVPVDWLPFYLSPQEFSSLPPHARITDVWCKIKVIGVRSAFDTGSTLSATATSEYCPILHTCVGLNNKFNISNVKYTTAAAAPMVPTGYGAISGTSMAEKYYNHATSSVMCVPRSATGYAMFMWNKEVYANTVENYEKYQPHLGKMARIDKYVNAYLMNSAIGEDVIDYRYRVKSGYINNPKITYQYGMGARQIPFQNRGSTLREVWWNNNDKRWEVSGTAYHEKHYQQATFSYSQSLEKSRSFTADGAALHNTPNQPQVHIGMQAIPQLNPATESTGFMNACVYYHITCGATVVGDINSDWTHGTAACHPSNAVFINYQSTPYNQPEVYFGQATDALNIAYVENVIERNESSPRFAKLVKSKGIEKIVQDMVL